jgi:hypothetical protein
MNAVFMVGEQRSGSNLLRLILNESNYVAAPHPPHILQRLMPVVGEKDLSDENKFKQLIEHVCHLVEANPVQWSGVVLDRKDIFERCRENSLIAIFGAVMDAYAEAQGATTWVCKSLQNIRWADQLDAYFDKPKYIYLYRDPRDVTLSFMKAVVGEKHPYFIAKQWDKLQTLCLQHGEKLPRNQFFGISYEDLISKSDEVITALCNFLEIEYQESMLRFHESKEASNAANSSKLWANVTQPIMKKNSHKFLEEMSEDELRIIESIAGNTIDKLGYERFKINRGYEQIFTRQDIEEFEKENELRKHNIVNVTDPGDMKRRKKQDGVIQRIISFSEEIQSVTRVA